MKGIMALAGDDVALEQRSRASHLSWGSYVDIGVITLALARRSSDLWGGFGW